MTGASAGKGLAQSARELVAAGGWQQLFRGNFTNVVRAAPQKALDFVAFDFALTQVAHAGHAFRKWRHRRAPGDPALPDPGDTPGDPTALQTLVAAGAAGVTSTVVLYPLEVVRSRLTVGNPGQYRGIMHAALTILRTEGLRGLYGGLGPSVAAILPEAAITYGMFDILKVTAGADPCYAFLLLALASTWLCWGRRYKYRRRAAGCKRDRKQKGWECEVILGAAKCVAGTAKRGSRMAEQDSCARCSLECDILSPARSQRKWQAATGNPDIGVVPAVSFGVVAALTGQLTAYPLELVSRRMQVQAIQGGALKGDSNRRDEVHSKMMLPCLLHSPPPVPSSAHHRALHRDLRMLQCRRSPRHPPPHPPRRRTLRALQRRRACLPEGGANGPLLLRDI